MVTELVVTLEATGVPGAAGMPVPPDSVVTLHAGLWFEVPDVLYALTVKLYVVFDARPVAV